MPSPPRVLIVDDQPEDRLLVRRLLGREWPDAQFVEATDRASLVRALQQCDYDLVVTEREMSWGSGFEVLRGIQGHRPDLPVIMFTGCADEGLASEALKAGIERYIVKSPAQVDRLASAARLSLHRSHTRRLRLPTKSDPQCLLDRLGAGLFRLKKEGDVLEANAAFLQLLGFASAEEARGVNLRDHFVRPEDGRELFGRLDSTGRVSSTEVHLRRADETSVWCCFSAVLTTATGDSVIDGLLVEVPRRRPPESPKGDEEWRRAALRNLPVTVFALDKEGNIAWLEGRNRAELGLRDQSGSLVGSSIFELFEDSPQLLGDVCDALAGEEVVSSVEIEGRMVGLRYAPICRQGGEVDGVVAVATVLGEHGTMQTSSTGTRETPG